MRAFRYDGRLLRAVLVGVGVALTLWAMPSAAAGRGSGGDYTLVSPTLSIDDVSAFEGDVGTTQFCFTISLTPTSNSPVDVVYYTTDGTATAGSDYQGVSSTVQIPANTSSVQVCIDVFGDLQVETDETFFVNIGTSTPGVNVGDNQGTGTIKNDDGIVPTLLQAFDTETVDGGIAVTWQFASSSTIKASWVERADVVTGPWTRVEAETQADGGMLKVVDRSIASEHTYLYRLTAQLSSGEFVKFGPIEAKSGVVVTEFAISQPSPNPTRNLTTIDYALPKQANVKIGVVDVTGRQVAVLVNGVMSAGRHQAVWNAATTGRSGVYFVTYEVPGRPTITRRVVVTQ